jgi:uncharacterized membrane protein
MQSGYEKLQALIAANKRSSSGRFADFIETMSLIIVIGALAGFGVIVVALVFSGFAAVQAGETLRYAVLLPGGAL